ncbi:allantoate amidohydrolase [Neobacillus ginsengisoli]|uniref:Allantoate deiminase n=1 Tax=Neobacillus ginsengisoli TaxID=904295 RepID=A0ABT9XVJ7_9BACI|nr:allantoate amidohydrolase [Neobacillus ginsengisoli]MDQ0199597.1 allantoate deiminase [Neobacillus ginsengisoli]
MADCKLQINGQRIARRIEELASCSEPSKGVTRLSFTKEFQSGQKLVEKWMIDAGMTVRIDNLNNIIGRYEGSKPDAPVILIGSHLDTVINGGKFDGMLGVISGIEIVNVLFENDTRLENPIEIIGFCDEEGVRFHSTFLGSKAIAGTFSEETLAVKDEQGVSLAGALQQLGLAPHNYQSAALDPKNVLGYLELHIEQGPVLEAEGLPCGIVSGIAGASRYSFKITGFAGHAGTVPVTLRKDALAGTAEWIIEIERLAKENVPIVATVGKLQVVPGASNVIPGEVNGTLDIRDTDVQRKNEVIKSIFRAAEEICEKRKLTFHVEKMMETAPTLCNNGITAAIESAILANGIKPIFLVSGAGHDAMAMAALTKIGMIFVRCKEGISHNPEEFASVKDMEIGAKVLLDTVIQLIVKDKNILKERVI